MRLRSWAEHDIEGVCHSGSGGRLEKFQRANAKLQVTKLVIDGPDGVIGEM